MLLYIKVNLIFNKFLITTYYSKQMRILLIEDEKETAAAIKKGLSNHFIVEVAATGEKGEYCAQVNTYDLLIIDWLLPDINGITICEYLRKAEIKTPILMLTANHEIEKKVMALDAGADDYLTKPFHLDELLARIQALLRRQTTENSSNLLTVDDLTLDLSRRVVTREGKIILLRRKELYLLEYLMRNYSRVVTRDMILDHIWDSTTDSLTNIVDVHIKYLRDKIDKPFKKKFIKTIHGLGYKMEA